jgi:hypothetical protein
MGPTSPVLHLSARGASTSDPHGVPYTPPNTSRYASDDQHLRCVSYATAFTAAAAPSLRRATAKPFEDSLELGSLG